MIPLWGYGAAAALVLGFGAGWQVQGWRCDAAQAAALRKAADKMDAAANRMRDASAQYETGRAYADAATYDRTERVRTIYRDRVVSAACAAPDDARRLLVEAVTEANARAAGQPVGPVPGAAPAP